MLAEDGAVDVVETVARDQTVSARRTGETLKKKIIIISDEPWRQNVDFMTSCMAMTEIVSTCPTLASYRSAVYI